MSIFRRHRSIDQDTVPLPPISPSAIEAYKVLEQVNKNKQEAEQRSNSVERDAQELIQRCADNHFYQGWLAIIDRGGAR